MVRWLVRLLVVWVIGWMFNRVGGWGWLAGGLVDGVGGDGRREDLRVPVCVRG